MSFFFSISFSTIVNVPNSASILNCILRDIAAPDPHKSPARLLDPSILSCRLESENDLLVFKTAVSAGSQDDARGEVLREDRLCRDDIAGDLMGKTEYAKMGGSAGPPSTAREIRRA